MPARKPNKRVFHGRPKAPKRKLKYRLKRRATGTLAAIRVLRWTPISQPQIKKLKKELMKSKNWRTLNLLEKSDIILMDRKGNLTGKNEKDLIVGTPPEISVPKKPKR